MENEKLMWFILHNYFAQYIGDDDVVQAARIGLWRATEKFDATRGTKFSTYASHAIINSVIRELRKNKKPTVSRAYVSLITKNDSTLTADEFLKSLSEIDASIVRALMEGYNQREIGEKHGVTGSAICARIKKIRQKAVKYFEPFT